MRQAAAIVLLFVLVLYHLGYYGFYLVASYQLDNDWQEKAFQEDFDEDKLLYTAIPFAVPYQRNQPEYEPANGGKVEVEGKFYRVVRQRYANDTLHVMYMPDVLQEELQLSVDKWLATIIPLPGSDSEGQQLWLSLTKSFLIHQVLQLDDPVRHISLHTYGDVTLPRYEYLSVIPSPPPRVS
uniref:Uncharacterized protein n=1 Tax=Roseihalotalea indica TaxID=2867963 RepID=A0AA49GKH2_9BACT|nr:hypothetical protein K4G66_25655 [Tunicatimonas sp. TK19036]